MFNRDSVRMSFPPELRSGWNRFSRAVAVSQLRRIRQAMEASVPQSYREGAVPYSEGSFLFVMIRIPFFSCLNCEMKPLLCKASARARLTSLSAIDGLLP